MPKVIALANQKGGTAKTTTAVNLGIGLAAQGKKGAAGGRRCPRQSDGFIRIPTAG